MTLKKSDGTVIATEVEYADSFVKQTLGLMFRKQIPKSYAMIFDMGYEQHPGIHMLFVFFPIDVVYLDKSRKIVGIRRKLPAWFGISFPVKKARYVIEMPAGTIELLQVKLNDKLEW